MKAKVNHVFPTGDVRVRVKGMSWTLNQECCTLLTDAPATDDDNSSDDDISSSELVGHSTVDMRASVVRSVSHRIQVDLLFLSNICLRALSICTVHSRQDPKR